jgi:hypothetical protein
MENWSALLETAIGFRIGDFLDMFIDFHRANEEFERKSESAADQLRFLSMAEGRRGGDACVTLCRLTKDGILAARSWRECVLN